MTTLDEKVQRMEDVLERLDVHDELTAQELREGIEGRTGPRDEGYLTEMLEAAELVLSAYEEV